MIVCALGYGYLTQFVFKRICALGIKGIGVTSKNINNDEKFLVPKKSII